MQVYNKWWKKNNDITIESKFFSSLSHHLHFITYTYNVCFIFITLSIQFHSERRHYFKQNLAKILKRKHCFNRETIAWMVENRNRRCTKKHAPHTPNNALLDLKVFALCWFVYENALILTQGSFITYIIMIYYCHRPPSSRMMQQNVCFFNFLIFFLLFIHKTVLRVR